ncbi:MAG: hypothetical protein HUU50_21730, partial [Candidatus Brocadiae bacterium]|nr:hypothetical protein [Candidatus Brocadiia bacterium]
MEQYPENVQKEEPTKQLLSQIYKELGYLPRIDLFTILRPEQISCFDGTAFEYLREIVCFEVHTSSLEEETFVKWYIELLGLYLMMAKDLKFQYQNFTGFSLLEHVPKNFLKTIPKEIVVPFDPVDKEKPCLIKIEGFIPWFFILKPHLRYDFFCLPINLMLPERHAELVPRLKQQEYHEHRILEEMAFKVLDWFYKKKGAPTMLDIASILEKSDDPSFVHFRKCRDMLLHQGKVEGKIEGKIEGK